MPKYFDRVVLLNVRLISSGTVDEAFTEALRRTYGGRSASSSWTADDRRDPRRRLHTLRTVALGAVALGIVSGALGTLPFFAGRRSSATRSRTQRCRASSSPYVLLGTKASLGLMLGAAVTGFAATLAVGGSSALHGSSNAARWGSCSPSSSASARPAIPVQRRPDASQAGLDRFLFGQAATVLQDDVVTIAIVGALALAAVVVLWKQLKPSPSTPSSAPAWA